MRPVTALAVVAIVSGPWFIAMQTYTNGHFMSEFLGVHHLNRFSQPMDNHGGPIIYYAIACLIGLYPWSAFAIPTALQWCKPPANHPATRARLFVTAWVMVYLVVFSLASTKLPNYVAPAYPAFAIAIGYYIAQWSLVPSIAERRWQLVGWACLMGVGLLLVTVPWVLTMQTQEGTWLDRFQIDEAMQRTVRWVSAIGIPLILGGCIGMHLRLLDRRRWLAPCFSATAIATMLLFWQVIVPRADRHQTPQDIAASLLQSESDSGVAPSIAVLSYFRPSMVFYAGRPIHFCKNNDELLEQLSSDSAPIVVLKEESLNEMRSQIPAGYRIVQRHPEFPRRGSVLVLSPPVVR
jgi:4-amino-4-deoxy-L-arabinose transferase-like glycosyltransferase